MATPKINISKISDFPKVTPTGSDRILIDRDGKGGSVSLSQIPIPDSVESRISDVDKRISVIASVIPEGGTTGDAELRDIRNPAEGFSVPEGANAADAVRAQVTQLDEKISNLKDGLTFAINELDDKKITKFYASNNGNTNLPDSDNGKPSDMKIFGKSVQDGTPSPDAPIEIQSVVNPVVRMMGKNLCLAKDVYAGADSYLETTLDGRACVRFTSGVTAQNKPIEFKENTQYTVSFDLKMVEYISGGFKETVFAFFYTDGSAMYAFADLKDFTIWKRMTITSHANKTVSTIGVYVQDYRTYCYVSNFQLEEGSTATGYVPYVATSASLPYTLNAIPVESGGNVTIDGQQYIADYVDVERRKLVRIVGAKRILNVEHLQSINSYGIANFIYHLSSTEAVNPYYRLVTNRFVQQSTLIANTKTQGVLLSGDTEFDFRINSSIASTVSEMNTWLTTNETFVYYMLAKSTETDLTESDITALSSLATYYPITNASVASDQLDGHAIFNYPLNMANGWNYVMQQIGEARPIIYDTQVKTIENLIDTAILTAMMEA